MPFLNIEDIDTGPDSPVDLQWFSNFPVERVPVTTPFVDRPKRPARDPLALRYTLQYGFNSASSELDVMVYFNVLVTDEE